MNRLEHKRGGTPLHPIIPGLFCNHVKAEKFIRSLNLTLPCLQTLSIPKSAIPDEAENVDFLSPPRYLHVAEPIIFEFVGNTELPDKSKACECCKFQDMLHHIHAKYSLPISEEKSLPDKDWHWIQQLVCKQYCDGEIWAPLTKVQAQLYTSWGRDIFPSRSLFDKGAVEKVKFVREKHWKREQQRSTGLGAMTYHGDSIFGLAASDMRTQGRLGRVQNGGISISRKSHLQD